jgi:hypothetical protein
VDARQDVVFIKEQITPYLKDLFKDLSLRCINAPPSTLIPGKVLDKATFFEYCSLPGLISDRFFKMFVEKDDQWISESSFITNMTKVFVSDFDTKMRLTFNV